MNSSRGSIHEWVRHKSEASPELDVTARKQGFRGWYTRGYLPHRDEPGLTQFVTFRLAGSFPRALRSEWEHLWAIEDKRIRRIEIEKYLDLGRGPHHLDNPTIAGAVETALTFFHNKRYNLLAWVVMPNHVHVLVTVWHVPLAKIVESWKKYTARYGNSILGERGRFWERDYWDTYIRSEQHERKTRKYIENNPVNARLTRAPEEWLWSSARFRDRYGRLNFP